MTQDFKKLEVWQDAKRFVSDIYNITTSFPPNEQFILTQQFRRAALSITANIAEGCGRGSNKDFVRFLYNAYGSLKECENFAIIAYELKYVDQKTFDILSEYTDRLGRKISRFIEYIDSLQMVDKHQSEIANRIIAKQ